MKTGSRSTRSVNSIIKDKMRCLEDFDICNRDDEEMIASLEKAVAANPEKDPQLVVDMYCRGIIQEKVMSWQ